MYLHLEANFPFENNLDAEAAILLPFRVQAKDLLPVQVFSQWSRNSGTWKPPVALSHADYLETDFECEKGFRLL